MDPSNVPVFHFSQCPLQKLLIDIIIRIYNSFILKKHKTRIAHKLQYSLHLYLFRFIPWRESVKADVYITYFKTFNFEVHTYLYTYIVYTQNSLTMLLWVSNFGYQLRSHIHEKQNHPKYPSSIFFGMTFTIFIRNLGSLQSSFGIHH